MAFFRFLDLPQEIQDNIYAKYFEDIAPAFRARTDCDWECTYGDAEVGFPDHDFAVIGKPNLAIDLVSRKVCGDARTARNKDMSRTLVIGKLTCDADGDIGAFCFDPKYFWLRNHIETLVFDKCLQGNFELVAPIVAQFPSVRNVEVRALTPFSTEDCTPDHLRETSSHVMMTGQERSDGMYADWSGLEHLAKDRPELSIKLVSSVFLRHTERSILWTSVRYSEATIADQDTDTCILGSCHGAFRLDKDADEVRRFDGNS